MLSKGELLSELSAIVYDAETDPEMTAHDVLGAVAEFVGAALRGGTDRNRGIPYRLRAAERAALAVKLAAERGAVSSGALARLCRCTPECARQTLIALVERGQLAKRGEKRGTRYMLTDGWMGTGPDIVDGL